ncbi:MAG: hypothetical protein IKN55_13285 [Oscillospiraceae bacterium]|nr:hypothetical protein [Oscillospiraceae bacterium]
MFSDQLTSLMNSLHLSSADLAKTMQCDTSNISRMCSGARVPKYGGNASMRLADGLYRAAADGADLPVLCGMIGCKETAVPEEIRHFLLTWLYEDTAIPVRTSTEQRYRSFGERLNAVMCLTELSNVRFGQLISMDASYISRFRNGLRSPRSNPDAVSTICQVLYERICRQGRHDELEQLIGHPLPDDPDAAFREFSMWLCDFSTNQTDPGIERLLETIDTFLPPPQPVLPETPSLPEQELYAGNDGLRSAVLRLLTEVLQKNGRELLLYSDMNMDWMTEQPAFLQNWSALMLACLRNGVQIRIIHNIDRSQDELLSAIRSWLPLYMSGSIRSYSLRPEEYGRFSHTLFLCPGLGCIESFQPVNCNGLFRYHTDSAIIDTYCGMFDALCSKASPLVQISQGVTLMELQPQTLTLVGTSLSFATMPLKVLHSVLSRSRLPEQQQRSIEQAWEICRQRLMQMLTGGTVEECCPLASDDALFGGKVPVELPGTSLFYTPQEYAEHIRAVLTLAESHKRFRFYPMPEAAFPNILLLLSDDSVSVSRLRAPGITFRTSHPLLCKAFLAYAAQIRAKHKISPAALRSRMERYL